MKMGITEYLKSLIKANSLDSSKSFALVLSSIVGALIGFCVCFCLIWDVCTNGYLKTDLDAFGTVHAVYRRFHGRRRYQQGFERA